MPGCEHYADWWYEDLPTKAKEAAHAMGYTHATWDDDSKIPYDDKGISECTIAEKTAAKYLSICPIKDKCDILWWEDTDDETKKYASIIGWDEHKWDEDWAIKDLEIEHKYWKELTSEEKEAATFFGYTEPVWDETYDIESLPDWTKPMNNKPSGGSSKKRKEEEKKENVSDDEDGDEPDQKKPTFKFSKSFGGDGGQPFDFGKSQGISKLVIHADRHCVHGLEITVKGGQVRKMGVVDGKTHEFTLEDNEFILSATIRANKLVQCLTFKTNKGRELGPAGGKGWLIGHDKEGPEETIQAPYKFQLCGFSGKGGKNLDQLKLIWGLVPARS